MTVYRCSPLVVVVAGPTASGKTTMGIQLAKHFNTSVIAADSRQVYKELCIGTAVPTPQQLAEVPHYLIQHQSIYEHYSVGHFEKDALAAIRQAHEQRPVVFLVGGTGLYIDAVCNGLDELPTPPDAVRAQVQAIYQQGGLAALQEQVQHIDPVYYATVDRQNPVRLIRALEVFFTTQRPFSSYRSGMRVERPFRVLKLCLHDSKEALHARIRARVFDMVAQGLVNEAAALAHVHSLKALQTVGYQEVFPYLDGACSLEDMIEQIAQHTRQYAKRQLTWFRKDTAYHWLLPTELPRAIQLVTQHIEDGANHGA